MTDTEALLIATIVAGFVVLLMTLGAFLAEKYRIGVVGLALGGACFVAALLLMARVSGEQEEATRRAVLEKYDVKIQQWSNPLGTSAEWEVNDQVVDCVVDLRDRSDPVVKCDGDELPLR